MPELDPEDRYPHRFDELWPRQDRVAYLADPNIWDRAWLVSEVGRLLEDDAITGDRLNTNGRLTMQLLAEIVVDLRDQRRTIETLEDRIREREQTIEYLEGRIERLQNDTT